MNAQLQDLTSMALVGDGIVGMIFPREHCLHWRIGPKGFRRFIDAFAAHPQLTRMLAAIEASFGIWLAARQKQ